VVERLCLEFNDDKFVKNVSVREACLAVGSTWEWRGSMALWPCGALRLNALVGIVVGMRRHKDIWISKKYGQKLDIKREIQERYDKELDSCL